MSCLFMTLLPICSKLCISLLSLPLSAQHRPPDPEKEDLVDSFDRFHSYLDRIFVNKYPKSNKVREVEKGKLPAGGFLHKLQPRVLSPSSDWAETQ